MDALRPLLRLARLLALLLLAPAVHADDRGEYERRREALELECAQRHVDLGIWCRDRGFNVAAREHFLTAIDVSRGRHVHANSIRWAMDSAGEAFWKKDVELSEKRRKPYDKKVEALELENQEAGFELAQWAFEKGLETEALESFGSLLDPDVPLAVDAKGRIETRAGPIPAACSDLILERAIAINGAPHVRRGFLELLPPASALSEASSSAFLVRTTGSLEEAQEFHALGTALQPELEAELGVPAKRRPTLFVFDARDDYDRYLVDADRQSYRSVSGFADVYRFVTVVCTEGKGELEVQSLVLHELSHLAEADAFPQSMPAWYREGFAESFGGEGAFAWDGVELAIGREMVSDRLTALRSASGRWPVAEMLRIDPLSLWGGDRAEAMRFYAQSWALYRWLSHHAPPDMRARWEAWIDDCKAAAPIFPPPPVPVPSTGELFDRRFGDVLGEVDRGLAAWLESR